METNPTYYTDLITRYFCGEATPGEILELEAWVKADPANAAVFSDYSRTWKTIENERIGSSTNIDLEWKKLLPKIETAEKSQNKISPPLQILKSEIVNPKSEIRNPKSEIINRKSYVLSWPLRIAAVLLILIVPSFYVYRYISFPVEKHLTASSGMIEQTLPDGTVVTLNSGATLSYPSRFEGSFRRVSLKGEAWFEVSHDKTRPFIVSSENVRIRVVGTSFFVNTRTLRAMKEVILSTGVVKVYYENSPDETVLLFPGERAEISTKEHSILKTTNEDVNYLAWKTKHIVFNNTPLNEVVALLTQVYHTNIRLSGDRLSDCRITTTFDRQSLESVLNVLKATLDLQVRNTGAGIELSGEGCYQNL